MDGRLPRVRPAGVRGCDVAVNLSSLNAMNQNHVEQAGSKKAYCPRYLDIEGHAWSGYQGHVTAITHGLPAFDDAVTHCHVR